MTEKAEKITIAMSPEHARPYAESRLKAAIARLKKSLETYKPEVIKACNACAKKRADEAGTIPPFDYADLVRRHWAYVVYIELEARLESARFAGDRPTVAYVRQILEWADDLSVLRSAILGQTSDTEALIKYRLPQPNQYREFLE